jgi:hypothetical protein
MGLPVHPAAAGTGRALIYCIDQRPAHALPSRRLRRKEIGQIAGWRGHYRASVKEVVGDADQHLASLGNQGVYRLIFVKESIPCQRGDLGRERRWAATPIELVVSIPEWQPPGEIRTERGSNSKCFSQDSRSGGPDDKIK